jgi:glycosyltransferase involved in cell wall biosynthesis
MPAWRPIRTMVRDGLANPIGTARRLWRQKPTVVLRLVDAVPPGLRRPVAGPAAVATRRLLTRAPSLPFLPEAAFLAHWAAEQPERAAALARTAGTAPRTARRSRRALARLVVAAGLRDTAWTILDSLAGDTSPGLEAVRARLALETGRYSKALEHAQRAAARGHHGSARIAARAEGRLAVLTPGWEPDLGPMAPRLAAICRRGRDVTRGRILHILSASLPYRQAGYTVRTQSVARCQIEAGLDPHFATRAGFPRTEGVHGASLDEMVDGIPYHRLAPDFTEPWLEDRLITESARAAVPLVERLRPAALQPASNHVHAQIALAIAAPLGIPVVYEVRGFLEETWASNPGLDEAEALRTDRYVMSKAAETRAMLASNAVVTLSETMRADIVARGYPAENVVVVPNAVDVDRFQPRPRDQSLARSLGIGPSDPVLGYISSFSPYEGIRFLLEAAAQLRADHPGLRVLLVGDGKDRSALVQAGRRLGLDDGTLIMPGRVPHDQVLQYYSLIDVFVVPRTGDRVSRLVTPLKPFEAMAMERAVVVSDVPALREIVTPGETGATFHAEDSGDLAATLGRLLDDPRLRQRLGRQARAWVVESRTWTQNGRRYRELYERLGVI